MELQPSNRFEWERLLRRVVVPRAGARNAAGPATVKHVGLTAATYGDVDGTRIRPGTARLAAVTGYSESTVERALRQLVDMGLLQRVVSGSRHGRRAWASEFRLSVPVDLLERFETLPVSEQTAPAPCDRTVDNRSESEDHPAPAPTDTADSGTEHRAPAPPETTDHPAPAPRSPGAGAYPPDQHQPPNQPEHFRLSTTVTPPTRDATVDEAKNDSPDGLCPHGLRNLIDENGPLCLSCRRQRMFEESA